MVHRLALLIGGVASLGVLALAVAGSGFFAATPTAAVDQAAPAVQSKDGAAGGQANQAPPRSDTGRVKTVIDKVYVAPTPHARVIRVPAGTKAVRPAQNTTTKTPAHADRDDSSDNESESDEHDNDGEHGERGESGERSGSSDRGDD